MLSQEIFNCIEIKNYIKNNRFEILKSIGYCDGKKKLEKEILFEKYEDYFNKIDSKLDKLLYEYLNDV